MDAHVVIRPAVITDLPGMNDLWRCTEGIGDLPDTKRFTCFLAVNPQLSQVAIAEDRVVGAALASFDGIRGYIYRLAVSRQFRRHGLARRMVAEIEARLRRCGAVRVNLHVFGANAPARHFWSAQGYHVYDDLLTMTRGLE
jgi:ribosomal protein S18 acetylase RimI-like enzyme